MAHAFRGLTYRFDQVRAAVAQVMAVHERGWVHTWDLGSAVRSALGADASEVHNDMLNGQITRALDALAEEGVLAKLPGRTRKVVGGHLHAVYLRPDVLTRLEAEQLAADEARQSLLSRTEELVRVLQVYGLMSAKTDPWTPITLDLGDWERVVEILQRG